MNKEIALQKLGLTSNEINVYLYLVRNGLKSGSEIYKDNEMDKSSSYEALKFLQEKELVYSIGQKRNQLFGAVPVKKLLDMTEEKKKELKKVEESVNNLMDEIDTFAKKSYKNKNITVLEGKRSYDKWSEAKHSAKKGSTIRELLSYIAKSKFIDNFDNYAPQVPLDRVAKGIFMKSLTTKEDIAEMRPRFPDVYRTNTKLMKEVRTLPLEPKFKIEANFATFDNKLSLLRFRDNQFFGIIIEDHLLTSLMNNMFDFIWYFSEEVK